MEAEQLHELEGIVEQISAFIGHAWPGLALLATGAVLLLTIYLLSALAKGHYEIPGPLFQRWKTPDHLVWLLILAGAGQLLASG